MEFNKKRKEEGDRKKASNSEPSTVSVVFAFHLEMPGSTDCCCHSGPRVPFFSAGLCHFWRWCIAGHRATALWQTSSQQKGQTKVSHHFLFPNRAVGLPPPHVFVYGNKIKKHPDVVGGGGVGKDLIRSRE